MKTNALGLAVGLPAAVVCERLRVAADQSGCNKRVLAFFLCEMEERQLFQSGPWGSTEHFGEAQLEVGHRRVWEYVQIGRMLRDLVLVDEAFLAGEIGWAKVVALLPVVQRETQAAWVEFAKSHCWRDVRVEVRASRPGQVPGEGDGYGVAVPHVLLQAKLDDETFRMLEQARVRLSVGGELLSDEALIAELLRRVMRGGGDPGDGADDAAGVGDAAGPKNTDEIPAATRLLVLHRDGYCCKNCRARFGLHVHHIRARARGGSNLGGNLLVLCRDCHASVHRGYLRLSGNPDRGVVLTAWDGAAIERAGPWRVHAGDQVLGASPTDYRSVQSQGAGSG